MTAAIAQVDSASKLGRMMFYMMITFIATGLLAGIYALVVVKIFPIGDNLILPIVKETSFSPTHFNVNQITNIFTVGGFNQLFSHEHILALIIFATFTGFAVRSTNDTGKQFVSFLQAGETVFMRVFALIMYLAPIGFFAYFSVLVAELGPKLLDSYLRVTMVYYVAGLVYFFLAFSLYAFIAGHWQGIRLFWRNCFLPVITSIATCSSAASIPANLIATKKMGVPAVIAETVIPLGSIIHKDGSVIGGVFKIAFLFAMFHLDFSGVCVLLTALGVSLLVGTVMGAIPGGGMLGELLILNVYGFPPSVLMTVVAISLIIDPLATMLNVLCNTVSSMMIARFSNYPLSED